MKEKFFQDGYLVIPNAVPEALRNRALRVINRSLGRGPDALPPSSPFRSIPKLVSSCPELMFSDEITDLIRKSGVIRYCHALIGTKTHRTWGGQIALRYPGDMCLPSDQLKQTEGTIQQIIINRGLQEMHEAQKKAGSSGEYANPQFDQEFQVVPNWQTNWHVDGWVR